MRAACGDAASRFALLGVQSTLRRISTGGCRCGAFGLVWLRASTVRARPATSSQSRRKIRSTQFVPPARYQATLETLIKEASSS